MVKVTNEMVDRGLKCTEGWDFTQHFCERCVRDILEAALNPPQEPEIVVTGEQATAGYEVANMWVRQKGCIGTSELYCMAKDIYRAMRKLEPPPTVFLERRAGGDRRVPNSTLQRDAIMNERRNRNTYSTVSGRRSTDARK